MPAQPAPTIVSVTQSGNVTFIRNGRTYTYNLNTSKLDKVTLIAIAKFQGVTFKGRPPMHWTTEEIMATITASLHGATPDGQPQPQPQPNPKPAPTVEVETDDDDIRRALDAVREAMESARRTSVVDDAEIQRINTRLDYQHMKLTSNHEELENRIHALAEDATSDRAELVAMVEQVREQIRNVVPNVIELHLPDRPVVTLDGVRHRQFAKVLAHVSAGNHLMMVGPAGTGKTTIAEQVAESLQIPFSCKSVTAQTSEAALLGYMSATGEYVTTEFRKRFEHGGVFLLDEVDSGNPNVLGVLNSALANSFVAFPDGMVKRHKDFVALACGNTFGNGATAEYVGRNPLDKAFTDRFMFMDIEIDESIETAMVMGVGLDADVAQRWLTFVRKVRKNVETHGLKVLVTPRGAFGGAKMLRTGAFTNDEVIASAILKGVRPEQASKMLEGASF